MDQAKIGKFISECRKKNGLTQMQLAEKLSITDRAISKWENGKGMPDASIMLALCNELNISVNELLSGERLEMSNYDEKLEQNLIAMVKEKESSDKKMLRLEIVLGYMSSLVFMGCIMIASFVYMQDFARVLLIAFGAISFSIGVASCIKIEQTAGYYECAKCHHKYVPTYKSVLWSMHTGRTRYMKCPKCNEKSWQKKVISKE